MSVETLYPDPRSRFEREIMAMLPQSSARAPAWYPEIDLRMAEDTRTGFKIGGKNRVALRKAQAHFQFDWLPANWQQLETLQQIFADLSTMEEHYPRDGDSAFALTLFGLADMRITVEELRCFAVQGPAALTDYFQNRLPTFIHTLDVFETMKRDSEEMRAQIAASEAKLTASVQATPGDTESATDAPVPSKAHRSLTLVSISKPLTIAGKNEPDVPA